MPTEETPLSRDFRALKEALKWDFYKRLLQGEIDGAKRTVNFLVKAVQQMHARVEDATEMFNAIDPEKTQTLVQTWNAFLMKFSEWQTTIGENVAGLTAAEFSADPKTWQALLQEAFRKLVGDIVDLLAVLERFSKALEKSVQTRQLVQFQYTTNYARQRGIMPQELLKRVDAAELKVRTYLSQKPPLLYKKKVTDKTRPSSPWAGHFHAWIAAPYDDYRLVYTWDGKMVLFETVSRHKDLGIRGGT